MCLYLGRFIILICKDAVRAAPRRGKNKFEADLAPTRDIAQALPTTPNIYIKPYTEQLNGIFAGKFTQTSLTCALPRFSNCRR
jgi:hypothetical protein